MKILFFLFVIMPIIEITVLIWVGGMIGAINTIGLIFLTALLGMMLLRQQGPSTLMRAQNKMRQGELPAKEMVEGIFLAVGGALLLAPGFVTDALGFCCLLPGIRQHVIGWGLKHINLQVVNTSNTRYTYREDSRSDHTTIEGQYRREDDDKP